MKKVSYQKATKRSHNERECSHDQSEFKKDQSRILYSIASRISAGKTQVLPVNDCCFLPRTRMQHMQEVAETSYRIAKKLGLHSDTARAIGLGHDLGHTIGGHAGEFALSEIYKQNNFSPIIFSHDKQLIHVVTNLEKIKKGFSGLNLTQFTLDSFKARSDRGIIKMINSGQERYKIDSQLSHILDTLEGQLVEVVDKMVYIVHDIEDAIRFNLIKIKDIANLPCFCSNLWKKINENINVAKSKSETNLVISEIKRQLYYYFFNSIIENCKHINNELDPKSYYYVSEKIIAFTDTVSDDFMNLKKFMYENIYQGKYCLERDQIFKDKIHFLFDRLMSDKKLRQRVNIWQYQWPKETPDHAQVTDLIWSLTEHMADQIILKIK